MRRTTILTAALLGLSPAIAQDTAPGGRHAWQIIAGAFAETVVEVAAPPVRTIALGAMPIELERTPLGAVQARFGGQVRHSGEAGSSMDWLCYRMEPSAYGPPMLVWLISDSEMSAGSGAITGIALEVPAARPPEVCGALPGDAAPNLGLPTLGADIALLKELFGAAAPDANGLVTYAYTAHIPPDTDTGQLLTYRLEGGRAVAVVVEQETTH